jgi:predicted sugar kinase
MAVLPLSHTVLLRRLRARRLMNKSMVVEISAETLINIFAAIVRADNSEFGRNLSLDHCVD